MIPAKTEHHKREENKKQNASKQENNRRKGTDKQRARHPRCAIRDKHGDRRLKRLEMNRYIYTLGCEMSKVRD